MSTDDLRQRIADTIRAAAKDCWDGCGLTEEECTRRHPIRVCATAHGVTSDIEGPVDAIAEALLPLVAAERAAETRTAADLIADLTDPDPCWYDHHGYCQAHGWFATDPSCPHARAKALRARADATEEQP